MRRLLSLWVTTLVVLAVRGNAVAAVTVVPDVGCPSSEVVESNLERLGALAVLSQLGTAEVRMEEPSLHVSFHDHRGQSLGVRVVTATSDCAARAALAATVIAAFAGPWAHTTLPRAPLATKAKQPAPVLVAASTSHPWQAELGAMAFGIHDGDAGGLGLGVRADASRGIWSGTALFELSSEREQTLGSGKGGYRFLRAGLGLGVCQRWPRVFWDASLLPMVGRLSLQGKNLQSPQSTSDWQFVLAAQTRVGWNGRRVRPFLFVGGSYSMPGERMTLTDRDTRVVLSPINVEAGLGMAFRLAP